MQDYYAAATWHLQKVLGTSQLVATAWQWVRPVCLCLLWTKQWKSFLEPYAQPHSNGFLFCLTSLHLSSEVLSSMQTSSIIFKQNLMFLSTRTSSTIQCLVCHPACQYGPSTRLLPQTTSGELLGRLILQPTPRSSMTQLFLCLVPTCPDGSGAFWTVSAQVLANVQPVFISGVTSTTPCASVELPRPCHTSLTAARYTSFKVVSLPFTQHLIPQWSGCTTAAYAKEKNGGVLQSRTAKGQTNGHC